MAGDKGAIRGTLRRPELAELWVLGEPLALPSLDADDPDDDER